MCFLKVDGKISLAVYRLLLRSERNQGLPCNEKERGHTAHEDSCWCWRQRWWLRDPNLGGVKQWYWIHKFTFQKCRSPLPLAANCRQPELTLSISIISPRMGNPPQRARQIDVAGPSASTHLVMDASEENWGSRNVCVLPTENKRSFATQYLP